jgi:transcriptional regulator of NAD metabolism
MIREQQLNGEERRNRIQKLLAEAGGPVSATHLAIKFGVSRQVIVQDVALIRASKESASSRIVATNRGYIIEQEMGACKRVITVCHTVDEIAEELNTVVDLGGKILDVIVDHDVYGNLTATLNVGSRYEVSEFVEEIKSGRSKPLSVLTSGWHAHTIEAESEARLDMIEEALKRFR